MRKAATILLLAFVVFTLGYAVGKEVGARRALEHAARDASGGADPAAPARQLVVRYYHGTKRCSTCNTLEAYAKETLETHFAKALAAKAVVWETANMDQAWNEDAVAEYGLLRSSLVLSDRRSGREDDYRVLNKLWDLTADKPAFVAHVKEAVDMVLAGWRAEDEE